MKSHVVALLAFFVSVFSQAALSSELGACEKVFAVATSAMENKQKGVSKESLNSALPPRSAEIESEPLRSMREIVEDVYSFEITNQLVYSVYKTEYCVRRQSGEPVPQSFSEIFPALELCAQGAKKNRIECAMSVAGSKK